MRRTLGSARPARVTTLGYGAVMSTTLCLYMGPAQNGIGAVMSTTHRRCIMDQEWDGMDAYMFLVVLNESFELLGTFLTK